MARRKREYEDDDGRTIVDMSGVSAPSMLGMGAAQPQHKKVPSPPQPETEERPWEDRSLTREERRMYALGALKAALLIGLAFLAGLAAVIALLLLFWS